MLRFGRWFQAASVTDLRRPRRRAVPIHGPERLEGRDLLSSGSFAVHIHQRLSILINGQEQVIPANIGIGPGGAGPIHTHDDTGTIHVETNDVRDFHLEEFFAAWGQPFDSQHVLDFTADARHPVWMTVNGQVNNELGGLVLRDNQVIVIRAGTVPVIAIGAEAGATPAVALFDVSSHVPRFNFEAYDTGFTGGVRVAAGDVTGDGVPDVITAPGPGGGPDVHLYDGKTGGLLRQFFAFGQAFAGGLYVAAGDVNADGFADVFVGADSGGGANVAVFDGNSISDGRPIIPLVNFFPYGQAFTGGVRVAAGDVNADGRADVICGAGPGGGPNVSVIDGVTLTLLQSYFPYDMRFSAGIYVSSADVDGDGKDDVVTGAGAGGGPNVAVFNANATLLLSFFPYDMRFTGGVRVASVDHNGDGRADIVAVPGPGGGPDIRTVNSLTGTQIDDFFADAIIFRTGLFVGAGQ